MRIPRLLTFLLAALPAGNPLHAAVSRADALAAMETATHFMVETVAHEGGYVWFYREDLSRRWGEMEAYPSMIWIEGNGTPAMGQLFLDAHRATGNPYYYAAAEKAGHALVRAQLACGGWNYMADFAGSASLENWYATVGRNGWRLEEFHHHHDNATFDDDVTQGATRFLLRLYAEKRDPAFRPALDRAIGFILASQYPIGGWPQRAPARAAFSKHGKPDYSAFITLNDDAHKGNVELLLECHTVLGDERLLEPIRRAMHAIRLLQHGAPQPGWSWQYTLDYEPTGARTYEPTGLYTGATYSAVGMLLDYFELTGDTRFLAGIPEAINWLESLRLPDAMLRHYPRQLAPGQHLYPSCVELGTDRPHYIHRTGSNTVNGKYYVTDTPEGMWMPTFSMRAFDTKRLRARYERMCSLPPAALKAAAPLMSRLPYRPHTAAPAAIDTASLEALVRAITPEHPYWPDTFPDSHPYSGPGPETPPPGDFRSTQVGDQHDTSPFRFGDDVQGISTRSYITSMRCLLAFVQPAETTTPP